MIGFKFALRYHSVVFLAGSCLFLAGCSGLLTAAHSLNTTSQITSWSFDSKTGNHQAEDLKQLLEEDKSEFIRTSILAIHEKDVGDRRFVSVDVKWIAKGSSLNVYRVVVIDHQGMQHMFALKVARRGRKLLDREISGFERLSETGLVPRLGSLIHKQVGSDIELYAYSEEFIEGDTVERLRRTDLFQRKELQYLREISRTWMKLGLVWAKRPAPKASSYPQIYFSGDVNGNNIMYRIRGEEIYGPPIIVDVGFPKLFSPYLLVAYLYRSFLYHKNGRKTKDWIFHTQHQCQALVDGIADAIGEEETANFFEQVLKETQISRSAIYEALAARIPSAHSG